LESLARKRKVAGDQIPAILNRINLALDSGDFAREVQFCVETVPEVFQLKKAVLQELDQILPAGTVLATNTSTMSITELASATSRPELFIGMHFFNPVVIYDPVEIIKGNETSEETLSLMKTLTESIGKIPIVVLKDVPGFMINRVQVPAQVLAFKVVASGTATPCQIDAMALKMGMPMGPFTLLDYLGLDVAKDACDYLADHLDPDFKMPQWVEDLVAQGCFGHKTGKGVFDYSCGTPEFDLNDLPEPEKIRMSDFVAIQVNEAAKLIAEGVLEDPADVDIAIMTGTGNKAGIFGLLAADRQAVIDRLTELADLYQVEIFRPTDFLQTIPIPNARKALKEKRKRLARLK
jgi:enoyl-CoA hydratase/3-hydroxyacyl-CoA dehydrogenase